MDTDIAIVCEIQEDEWKGEVGRGLAALREAIEQYKALNIRLDELHVSSVFHGAAAYWLLKDESYPGGVRSPEGTNPNKEIVRELIKAGVSIEMCSLTMKENGWTKKDLLPGVKVVPAAYPRVIDLEHQGYVPIISVR